MDLQDEYALSYLFVSRGLESVEYMAHRVAVTYLGKRMEVAPAASLFARREGQRDVETPLETLEQGTHHRVACFHPHLAD